MMMDGFGGGDDEFLGVDDSGGMMNGTDFGFLGGDFRGDFGGDFGGGVDFNMGFEGGGMEEESDEQQVRPGGRIWHPRHLCLATMTRYHRQ
jgi:hypothetical protein